MGAFFPVRTCVCCTRTFYCILGTELDKIHNVEIFGKRFRFDMFCGLKSHIDLKLKVRTKFSEEHKTNSTPYIQSTTVPFCSKVSRYKNV